MFGLTEERVKRAGSEVIIMHPGPINRGVEISSAVADGPYSVILNQVTNGVAVRMAVLYLLAGGAPVESVPLDAPLIFEDSGAGQVSDSSSYYKWLRIRQ